MDTPPTIQFDLLSGIRPNGSKGSNQVGIVQVKMDLTKLDTEPLYTQDAIIPYDAVDTWASPLLFKGVPAILCETSKGSVDGVISIVPYPQRSQQGHYTGWLKPLQKIDVLNMNSNGRNWHGIEAMSDNIFFVADSQAKYQTGPNAPAPYGGCLDLLDAEGHTIESDIYLEGAHAVTWDPTSRHIFAVGARHLHVYSDRSYRDSHDQAALVPVGVVDYTLMYEGRDVDGWANNADGGHDLYFMAGERRLFLTTGERCFSVDIDRLLLDLAEEPTMPNQIKTLVWRQTGDCGIDRFESLFKVKSTLSDGYFNGSHKYPSYPRDKVGAKAINRVPGTSVTFVHGCPYYPYPAGQDYLSKILLVSRGEYDRPSLRPEDPSSNLQMILKSKTYRCRLIPQLPTAKIMPVLPVQESAKIQFCSWTGSLGKVGFPYLRVTGIDQQIGDLFSTLAVPSNMDQDNFVYGYVVIEQDDCQREAIIRIHQCTETSGDCDGMLVGTSQKYLVAVYAWATPFVLDWIAKKASGGNDLTITVENVRPNDQRLVSISAWIRTSPLSPGMMVQLSKIDLETGSHSETISGSQPFYSIMLFAKSMEGFLYCSGEQVLEARVKVDGVEP